MRFPMVIPVSRRSGTRSRFTTLLLSLAGLVLACLAAPMPAQALCTWAIQILSDWAMAVRNGL